MEYKGFTYTPAPKTAWDSLSMLEKSEMMKVAVRNGITDLKTIREKYNEYAEGGDTNPAMTGMMKSKLAISAHFGNPTARRMANYDTRSYTWPGEYEYDKGIGEPKRGNVYVGSYGNLITPQIQDNGKGLVFIDNVWSPKNDQRSYMQSLKFDNEADAIYFGEHYKEVAPMMGLYDSGGKIYIKPENRGKFTALKERTGHSATWFKEHGTPAQKKMATFALNARHWKHGLGGNLFEKAGQMQIGRPFYSYDWNGNKITDASGNPILNYNVSLPEIVVVPDSRLSPAERNYRQRQRQKTFTDYAEQNSRDYTTRQSIAAQRQWENSLQKKALDFGIAAAQGIGMASDVVAPFFGGIPVYSGLKGAQALDRATTTNELADYVDAALWLSPMLTVAGKKVYDATKPAISEAYNQLVDNGTLWDAYTTFGGRFGNYGDNIFTNMYGTAARRFGLPDKARIPADAIRKLEERPNVENGIIDLTGEKAFLGNPHTNMTLDQPVVSHPKWVGDGADTYLFPTKNVVGNTGEALKSIEPSDMFVNGVKVTETPKNVTLISGDIDALNWAKENGLQTVSSPKLRKMYAEAVAKYEKDLKAYNKLSLLEKANQKPPIHPKEVSRRQLYWPEYATEVQRLQSRRGTPTLADFKLLEKQTGLNSGVSPISELQTTIEQFHSLPVDKDGVIKPLIYPNGRIVDISGKSAKDTEFKLIKRAKYNNVFYDPASMVEYNWQIANGLQ